MVTVDDTALAVTDGGGPGIPVVYLNGQFAARGVDRALVVGWSYGAFLAAHWASRNPDRCVGAVLVDGAQPCRRGRQTWEAVPQMTGLDTILAW